MLELAGQPALSDFRLKKAARDVCRKPTSRVKQSTRALPYFVDLSSSHSPKPNAKRLEALLLVRREARQAWPRRGATDALRRAATRHDLPVVEQGNRHCSCLRPRGRQRIERGICYARDVQGSTSRRTCLHLSPAAVRSHDRAVLECERRGGAAVRAPTSRRRSATVPLGDDGKAMRCTRTGKRRSSASRCPMTRSTTSSRATATWP